MNDTKDLEPFYQNEKGERMPHIRMTLQQLQIFGIMLDHAFVDLIHKQKHKGGTLFDLVFDNNEADLLKPKPSIMLVGSKPNINCEVKYCCDLLKEGIPPSSHKFSKEYSAS